MSSVAATLEELVHSSQSQSDALPTVRLSASQELRANGAVRATPPPASGTPAPRLTTPLPASKTLAPGMTTPLPAPRPWHSTLGQANGELRAAAGPRGGMGRRVLVASAAALVVGTGALLAWRPTERSPEPHGSTPLLIAGTPTAALPTDGTAKPPARQPAAPEAAATSAGNAPPEQEATPTSARRVNIALDSQPAGADIYLASDGTHLGRTPWRGQLESSAHEALFRFRLKGYHEASMSLPLDRDGAQTITLVRRKTEKTNDKPPEQKLIKNGVVDPFAE
jgi:hypothetical protein